eukprot:CAMPEP_0113564740 /NCGR_PEP_ID=MMETSP0015_2-20120614/21789_1 /TAXON_ID=2838 /ORGANISM="Odontella" /LENGTH=38 /DNA_ID=CAMNT_0000466859 /DNA_START=112 /DNA_END=225 /DNA_ORIENTATION=+ /assembly_acc=CAM_ASM_000160
MCQGMLRLSGVDNMAVLKEHWIPPRTGHQAGDGEGRRI